MNLFSVAAWACAQDLRADGLRIEISTEEERVRVMPGGRTAQSQPTPFEFEMGDRRFLVVAQEMNEIRALAILDAATSETLFVLPFANAEDELARAEFSGSAGNHGLLTLETREKTYLLTIDQATTQQTSED